MKPAQFRKEKQGIAGQVQIREKYRKLGEWIQDEIKVEKNADGTKVKILTGSAFTGNGKQRQVLVKGPCTVP